MNKSSSKHISQQRKERTIKQLKLRIRLLSRLINFGVFPVKFIAYQSHNKMCRYESGVLAAVSLNAAKNQKALWNTLKNKMNEYSDQKKRWLNKRTSTSTSLSQQFGQQQHLPESKTALRLKIKELKQQIQKLTNDLIMVRGAYLDLMNKLGNSSLSERERDAIRRHKEHHGLREVFKR